MTLAIVAGLAALAFWKEKLLLYIFSTVASLFFGLSMANSSTVASTSWIIGLVTALLGTYTFFKAVEIGLNWNKSK